MKLPQLAPSNRYILPLYSRNSQNKIEASCNIKILNPLIPFLNKSKNLSTPVNKANEVMSPVPPSRVFKSKFGVSRLSPTLVSKRSTPKAKNSTFLKRKYVESLDKDRDSDFSMNFTRAINNYSVIEPKKELKSNMRTTKSKKIEIKDSEIKLDVARLKNKICENIVNRPKYSNFVIPSPFFIENKADDKPKRKQTKIEREDDKNRRFLNQSLQTDSDVFEFDGWEFDYDS